MRYDRARSRVVAISVVCVAMAACTVANNDEPIELTGSIPFGLLETTTTTTPTTAAATQTEEAVVYLIDVRNGTSLVGVPRNVDVGASVQVILRNLFTVRPDGTERPAEDGLATALPESAVLLSATIAESTSRLIVDVRGLFGNEGIQGTNLRNALAQIVWTATEEVNVSEVVFRNNGAPVQTLVDNGEVVEGPVNRGNYARRI